jgi:dUTP pyrophosphatase
MKVKIRRANPDIALPTYGTPESAAFDIASSEDIIIQPKEVKLVNTGLYFQCPPGYFLAMFSRSSTPSKKGLLPPHGVGVLDPDYAGPNDEAHILVHNFTDKPVEIKKGDRLAQGIFLPFQQVEWEEVEALRETTRGGLGSTGI